jgi:hypothetical protein
MTAQWPEYFLGQTAVVQGTFKNEVGDLANPSTVTGSCTAPDGTVSSITVANASTGIYQAKIVLNQLGWWGYTLTGTESDGDHDVVSGRMYCRKPY